MLRKTPIVGVPLFGGVLCDVPGMSLVLRPPGHRDGQMAGILLAVLAWVGEGRQGRGQLGERGTVLGAAPAVSHRRAGGGQAWPCSRCGPQPCSPACACLRESCGHGHACEVKSRARAAVCCTPSSCAPHPAVTTTQLCAPIQLCQARTLAH